MSQICSRPSATILPAAAAAGLVARGREATAAPVARPFDFGGLFLLRAISSAPRGDDAETVRDREFPA
jgi:hypothetical protein